MERKRIMKENTKIVVYEERPVTSKPKLPSGQYVISDPCYVLDKESNLEDVYDWMVNETGKFANTNISRYHEIDQVEWTWLACNDFIFFVSNTVDGDGTYPVFPAYKGFKEIPGSSKSLGVDTGMLGVFPMDMFDSSFQSKIKDMGLYIFEAENEFSVDRVDSLIEIDDGNDHQIVVDIGGMTEETDEDTGDYD